MNVTPGIKADIVQWLAVEIGGTTASDACSRYLGQYTRQHVNCSLSELKLSGELVAVDEPFGKRTRRRYFHPKHAPAAALRPVGGNPITRAGSADAIRTRVLDRNAQPVGKMPEPVQCPPWEDRRFKPEFVRNHFSDLKPGQYDADSAGRWAERLVEGR